MNETVLKDLEKKVQENRLRNLAINIVKYQNFRTSAVLNKIDWCGYTKSAVSTYINLGINYLKNKTKYKKAGHLYHFIDEAKSTCVTPLVPKENEKRLIKIKKQKIIQVQKVLEKINEQALSKENNIFLGIKIGNKIIVKESLDEIKAFQEGLIFMGNNDSKIVKVKIEEVNEE